MKANLIIKLLAVSLWFGLAHLIWADEVRIIKDSGEAGSGSGASEKENTDVTKQANAKNQSKDGAQRKELDEKAEIVRQFFDYEGISADVDEDMLAHYEPEVVEKMATMLRKKGDFVAVFRLNSEVNSLIYELFERQVSKGESGVMNLPTELRALEQMVPNSEAQPTFELAKADLRKFCLEQPKHCAELMGRVKLRLESKEFHTLDAMSFLEGFYYNWVPLGRLSKYIEDFGQAAA